jgi:hypothetical protein
MPGPVYILTEADFDYLTTLLDRDPRHGDRGGSSTAPNKQEAQAYEEAHRFYNYQVRRWIGEMKSPK